EYPVVVKADGLAAGKGVFVCASTEEALAAVERIMVREEFGRAAGRQVVVEKRLDGEELSIQALVAGRTIGPLAPAPDHKGGVDAGPQGGLRRRPGAEHGRDGRVLPGAAGHAGAAPRGGRVDPGADGARAEARAAAVPRGAVRGPDGDQPGAARAGVQLPPGR